MLRLFVGIVLLSVALQSSGCADIESDEAVEPSNSRTGIHYIEAGGGEPVVLVHGFGQTHAAWLTTPLYQELIEDYRVIAVDLRGHGDSDKPHNPMAYGANMRRDLTELLDYLDIDKAHFVGFSLGASIVGDLAATNPERVRSATMASGFFTTWDEAEEEFAQELENRSPGDDRHPWEPANQDYRALAAVVRGARHAIVSAEQINSITTPILVVYGSVEIDHMTEVQRLQLTDAPSSITMLVVEGADHDSSEAALLSREFTQAVRELLASHPMQQVR